MKRYPFVTLFVLLSLLLSSAPAVGLSTVAGYQTPGPVSVMAADAFDPAALQASDWWATVQEDIRQSEYHVTWQDQTCLMDVAAAYQAPNRAHNLRTYFTPTGIRVIPRASDSTTRDPQAPGPNPQWEWGLTLTGYGYEGHIQPVGNLIQTTANDNRFEYQYIPQESEIIEWYLNAERGLEQGFTIQSPPLPRSSTPLLLGLTFSSDLTPIPTDDGQAVEFTTPDGVTVLRYGDLHVTDATGRELPAHFSLSPLSISIVVDEENAVYPITIAPFITGLSTTPNWTAESDQERAWFGVSVGTAGDVNGDGYADVIVGAYRYDNGQTEEGRAFVYHGASTGLSTSPAWTAESDQAGAQFGRSVGTAGDVNGDGYADVIVGADNYRNGQADEGQAYVYHGASTGLSTSPAWTVEGDQATAYFGFSVGTAGDVNGDGYADVIVGAHGYDSGQWKEGQALVYHGSSTGLSTSPAWTAESDQVSAYFGVSVGTAGDVNGDGYADVIVGAHLYDNGQADEGQAYVYHGSSAGLSTSPTWTAESDLVDAEFGRSVGTAGDVNGDGYADVIVGADNYSNGQWNEGQALVYYGSSMGLSTSPAWTAESDQAYAHFGRPVGTAGDVNGDGYADVIVGACLYDNGQNNEGRAFVYHGASTGLSTSLAWTAESDQAGAQFGESVGTAGDVNGDGYADVVVGAAWYDNGQNNEGRAFVYHGSAANVPPTVTTDHESASVAEGQIAYNTGLVSDPDNDPVTLSASIGTVTNNSDGTWSWSFVTSDGPAESQTVVISADDGQGGTSQTTFVLTVNNVAPTATLANDGPVDEGTSATVSFSSAYDPSSADTAAGFHFAFACDNGSLDGTTYANSGTDSLTACTFDDDGTYTVRARIIDKDNGFTEYQTTVTVNNVAPTASFNAPVDVNEGSDINLSLTDSFDPSSADTSAGFEYAFDCGAGYSPFGISNSAVCPTDDNGTRAVKGKIKDKDGGETEYIASVTVNNVAPSIDAITAPVDPVNINDQPVSVEVTFSDPGTADTHDVTWVWDDVSSDTQYGATSPASQAHTYAEAGVYVVTVTVTDDDGGLTTQAYEFIVIYDPEGGFVTAGGWIWSEAGFCKLTSECEGAEGKANFGFVSKYKKGANVPTGETEFQFKAGNLNFHSDSYDWLVVAGHKAKYKGVGTINGAGNYGFMLSAIDEKLTPSTDVDLFRIKIWDKDDGDTIVYDNQMGAEDDADPSTAIGGGSIVIHKE